MSFERALRLCLIAAVALTASRVAHAQDESSDEAPEAAPEEDPRFAEARERFLRGLELARAGNCSGAIAEFNASVAILPRPNTLFNIARCQESLYRYDLAIEAYEQYLEIAPVDDQDRTTVDATMRQLRNLLGTIEVQSNVEAEVWLQDRVVGAAPGEVLVPGGRHVLELRASGRLPDRREVEVSARGRSTVTFELRTAETNVTTNVRNVSYEAPPLPPALTVAMMVAAVATVGVGAGFGVSAVLQSEDVRASDGRLPRDLASISDAALYADILYIAGGVLGATAVVMAFLTDWSDGANESESVRVVPLLGPLYAGLRVEGLQ